METDQGGLLSCVVRSPQVALGRLIENASGPIPSLGSSKVPPLGLSEASGGIMKRGIFNQSLTAPGSFLFISKMLDLDEQLWLPFFFCF